MNKIFGKRTSGSQFRNLTSESFNYRAGSEKYYDVAESRKKYFVLTISNILQFITDFRDF